MAAYAWYQVPFTIVGRKVSYILFTCAFYFTCLVPGIVYRYRVNVVSSAYVFCYQPVLIMGTFSIEILLVVYNRSFY